MQPDSAPPGANGKIVVIVMLLVGVTAGYILSRNMPRANPKLTEPGTPYYSPPSDDEIKAMREADKKKGSK